LAHFCDVGQLCALCEYLQNAFLILDFGFWILDFGFAGAY
jgi:hypothetical protein